MKAPFTFRFALIALVLVSVIPLAAGISISAYLNSESTIRTMWGNLAHELVEDASEKTLRYLEPGPSQLKLHRLMARDGSLPLDDKEAIVLAMIRCIRTQETITWCSYANREQSYYSAQRGPKGEISISIREQVKEGTKISLRKISADDKELSRSSSIGRFLPEERPWWQVGKGSRSPTWSTPFLFASAQAPGIVLTLSQSDKSGEFQGIWLAEYELSYLADFLQRMQQQAREIGGPFAQALVTVLDEDGVVLGHPDGQQPHSADNELSLTKAAEHPDERLQKGYEALKKQPHQPFVQLDYQVEVNGEEREYLGVAAQLDLGLAPDWTIFIALPADALLAPIRDSNRVAALLASLVALLSTLLGIFLANRFVRPLAQIAQDLEAIGSLKLPEEFKEQKSIIKEIDHMLDARNRMGGGLRSFSKYVPADLVRELMSDGREARLGGTTQPLTVYFSDIAGFTSISEKLTPQELVNALADYLGQMSEIIAEEKGTVDKYIGDAIMAFWGAPQPLSNHALSACKAALRCQSRLNTLREAMKAQRGIDLHARIGLNSGDVLVGNIGSDKRMNYTVMGDAVNVASRLEAQCKAYGVQILIGDSTKELAGPEILTRPLDKIAVKGKEQGIVVHELVALTRDASTEQLKFCSDFESAFHLYLNGDFESATKAFEHLLELAPDDQPARILAERSEKNLIAPPSYWDGIIRLTKK